MHPEFAGPALDPQRSAGRADLAGHRGTHLIAPEPQPSRVDFEPLGTLLARLEPQLRHRRRGIRRTTDAVPGPLRPAHGRVDVEADLHRPCQVGVEGNVAGVAVDAARQLSNPAGVLADRPADRAQHAPAQVQQAAVRGVEEDVQQLHPIDTPAVRQLERSHARHLQVGRGPQVGFQAPDQVRGIVRSGQLCRAEFQPAGVELLRRRQRGHGMRLRVADVEFQRPRERHRLPDARARQQGSRHDRPEPGTRDDPGEHLDVGPVGGRAKPDTRGDLRERAAGEPSKYLVEVALDPLERELLVPHPPPVRTGLRRIVSLAPPVQHRSEVHR